MVILAFASNGFAATAVFTGPDTTTEGNWKGTYGADGSNVIGGTASYPAYATVTPSGNATYVWTSNTTDARALQTASGSGRIAGTWYSASSFNIDINLTDSQSHTVAIYFLDWEVSGRGQTITVQDATSHANLDTRNLSNFGNGEYLVWTLTGHVTFTVTRSAGDNAVVAGLFFSPPPIVGTPTATVSFVRTDSSTQGKWKTVYGTDGYDVISDSQSLPSYLNAVVPTGNNSYTWTSSTSDARALQKGSGAGQIAACWYSSGAFTIDLNLTGGVTHNVSAYFLDWEVSGRTEKIDLIDTGTGIVLDSRTVVGFGGGQYWVWTISGHVTMRISALGGDNAVISGLFFDQSGNVQPTSTATFVTTDTVTQGNWNVPYGVGKGPYGTDGYVIPNDSTKFPSYATTSVTGAAPYTWIGSNGDGRSLITGSGSSRIASTWFSNSAFSLDVNLTDSNVHQIALYCVDWDNGARAEKIQVLDYATGVVLDTRSISSFVGGVYLVWNIKGHVTVTVSLTGGANAVVSGIFFGGGTLKQPTSNPIQTENSLPGTSSWQLTNPATANEIEGYASLTSVTANNQISFFVNTRDPTYTLQIYRMGWYGGTGARQVLGPITLTGIPQPTPVPDPTTGLMECAWTNPYVLTVPSASSWPSGVYLVKLTGTSSGKQSYIIFVVREDTRSSKYLFQTAVTTYQAYNNWGGKSLYAINSTNSQPAYKVSFNRPYALGAQLQSEWGVGAGHFLTTVQPVLYTPAEGWEYNMVRFLEREGYDVTYNTDVDTHENASLLLNHKGILVVGHDEYWSWQMRSNFEAARDSGVNLAFFAANTCYWQIRFEPSSVNGAVDRNIVGYKEMALTLDPYATDSNPSNDQYITTYWRKNSVKPPEDALVGVMYLVDPIASDIIIKNASNSIFTLTGLNDGNALPGLLGYEVDEAFGNAPSTQVLLSSTPTTYSMWPPPAQGPGANMSIYTAPSGATVFAAGSIWWSWGLDDDYFSPAIRTSRLNAIAQQITRNVLLRFAP
jgi:hypothetical protein